MKSKLAVTTILVLITAVLASPTYAGSGLASIGKPCKTLGAKAKMAGQNLICSKSGRNVIWVAATNKVPAPSNAGVQNIYENQSCPSFEANYSFLGHGLTGIVKLTCANMDGNYSWISQNNSTQNSQISPNVQNIYENQSCPSFEANYSFLGHGLTGIVKLTCANIGGNYLWSSPQKAPLAPLGNSTSNSIPTPSQTNSCEPSEVQPLISSGLSPNSQNLLSDGLVGGNLQKWSYGLWNSSKCYVDITINAEVACQSGSPIPDLLSFQVPPASRLVLDTFAFQNAVSTCNSRLTDVGGTLNVQFDPNRSPTFQINSTSISFDTSVPPNPTFPFSKADGIFPIVNSSVSTPAQTPTVQGPVVDTTKNATALGYLWNSTQYYGDMTWLQRQVVVTQSSENTYFSIIGNNTPPFYMGIQELGRDQLGNPVRVAIFSAWDTSGATTIKNVGSGVRSDTFTNEGSGLKSFIDNFNWRVGDIVSALVHLTSDSSGSYISAAIRLNNEPWRYFATYRYTNTYLNLNPGYSFIEDFGLTPLVIRSAEYSNTWMENESGTKRVDIDSVQMTTTPNDNQAFHKIKQRAPDGVWGQIGGSQDPTTLFGQLVNLSPASGGKISVDARNAIASGFNALP